jgi:predicted O-linked N-acetylglucosamine transferase (SPINDLY family)
MDMTLQGARAAHLAGDLDAAEAGFHAVLGTDGIEALQGLGLIRLARGDTVIARTMLEAAYRLAPDARAAHNLAVVLVRLGCIAEAIACTREAAALAPDYVPARFALAELLAKSGARTAASEELSQFAEQALRAGDTAVAEQTLQRLLALDADNPGLLWLANLLQMTGREAAARDVLAIRQRAVPDDLGAHLTRAMMQFTRVHVDEADINRRRDAYAAELAALAALTETATPVALAQGAAAIGLAQPFLLSYHGRDDRDLQRTYGGIVTRLAGAVAGPPPPLPPPPRPGEPIRVGFASAYLHMHSVAKTHAGWIEHLDRSRFSVFGYQLGPARDAVSERIEAGCTRFVRGLAAPEVWQTLILADAPHVLIYLDIGMEQTAVRLAARRLAPVQCTTWGHPVTSGLPTIDYYLSSMAMEPPDGDSHYTERLVRLPGLGICYTPPPTDGVPDRAALGLGDDAVVYLCCQSLYKYLPRYDCVWPRIALRVPAARFLFIASNTGNCDAVLRGRLDRAFTAAGLDWQRHCILVPSVPHHRFPALLRAGDVFLDSLGWSGCNSTLEAIACDLPVVTTPGALMRGRHSAAILACMGLADWVAANLDEYVALAVRLADAGERARFTAALRAQRSRLFCDTAPVRALEAFLVQAVGDTR